VDDADWERCRAWRTFVVQRVVHSLAVEDVSWAEGRPVLSSGIPCVGSYLAGDRWGGLYVRLGDRVTTNRARHVGAFSESPPR
jgi:hypothetical protein